jgi:peptidoglycan/LPS O-acetylase OafA/YrhL
MHYFASYFKEVSLVHDLMHYFLFLVIGDCLSRFVLEERNAKLISSTRLTALIMPIFIFCQWLWLNHDLNIFTHFIIALVGCTLMVNLCFKLQSSKSFFWLRYVGFYSLYIYVMHVIIGAGVRVLLISVLGLSNPTIIFILATFCAVIIPIMLYNAAIKFGLWFLFNLGKPKRLAVSSSL